MIGCNTSKKIIQNYGFDFLSGFDLEPLLGSAKNRNIQEFLKDRLAVNDLLVFLGDKWNNLKISKLSSLKLGGKSFVFTGSFNPHKRTDFEDFVKSHGAKVSSSPNAKTTAMIVGELPTSHKVIKAKKLGIEIWNIETFIKFKESL